MFGIHACLDASLAAPARVHMTLVRILGKCPVVVGTIVSIKKTFLIILTITNTLGV